MDKYTDFTHPNQPDSLNLYQKQSIMKDTEDRSTVIDNILRMLLHRMLQDAAPPAETLNIIMKKVCSLNLGGSG